MKAEGIKSERGFTLVEITIVMGITALLLTATVIAFAGAPKYPQYTAAVDQLQIAAQNLQNQSTATISTVKNGGQSNYVIFGKAMLFNPDTSTDPATNIPYNQEYVRATLIQAVGDASDLLFLCEDPPTQLPVGMTYDPFDTKQRAIVFHDNVDWGLGGDDDGTGLGYTVNASQINPTICTNPGTPVTGTSVSNSTGDSDITDINNYSLSNVPFKNVKIRLVDPTVPGKTHWAKLDVFTAKNQITREFSY